MRKTLLTALAGAALLAGCGEDSDKQRSAAVADTIAIAEFKYSPTPATMKAGQKVTVSNADDAPHTLTDRARERTFDSGTIKGGASGAVMFEKAGTFDYFCEFHPYMKGKVTVVE